MNAMEAKTESFTKATTIRTASEIASFMNEATASVIANRNNPTSLLTRAIRVPVGCL